MKLGRAAIRRINFTLKRQISGRRIEIPVINGLKVGVSGEPFLFDVLKYFLPKLDGAVVDVGANIGQTLCKVKLTDPDREYYGFEPNPACHAYLENLVQANGWSDVSIFPCGLSDRTSMLQLHVSPGESTDGLGSFLPSFVPDGKREVQLSWIKYAAAFSYADIEYLVRDRIACVKVDVEGTELEVVSGMMRALQRDEPIVAMELIPDATLHLRHTATVQLLQSLDYELYAIDKGAKGEWAGLRPMSSYRVPNNPAMSDYLVVPRNKLPLLDASLVK